VKRDPVQEALVALAEAAKRPRDDRFITLIRESLGHRSNHVVGRAARAVREADIAILAPDLIAAFPRFLDDPIRRDPGCVAKTQIVHALLAFDYPAPDVYLCGVVHVQREPSFGPPVDTAPELRAISAMALVVMEHPAGLGACVNLLVDPEPVARAGGLRGLVASGRPDIALLARLFVLRGDDDPGVLAEAFVALLTLSTDDPVPFVAERLRAADHDIARAAALALGEARRPDAIGALRTHLPTEQRSDVRHAVILALATTRDEDALSVLLELIATGGAADSKAAAEALRLYQHDLDLQRRVEAALGRRNVESRDAPARRRKVPAPKR